MASLFHHVSLSPQRLLSLITSLSHGGYFWRGSWVWRGGETGKLDRRGMVAISGYFWFAAAISGYFWFAAARLICIWVCVNFDLIYYGSNLVAFDLFWVLIYSGYYV